MRLVLLEYVIGRSAACARAARQQKLPHKQRHYRNEHHGGDHNGHDDPNLLPIGGLLVALAIIVFTNIKNNKHTMYQKESCVSFIIGTVEC